MFSERLLPLENSRRGIWCCLITIFSQFLSVCFLNLGSLHGSATTQWGKLVFFPQILRHGPLLHSEVEVDDIALGLSSNYPCHRLGITSHRAGNNILLPKPYYIHHLQPLCVRGDSNVCARVCKQSSQMYARIWLCIQALPLPACFHCKWALSILEGKL